MAVLWALGPVKVCPSDGRSFTIHTSAQLRTGLLNIFKERYLTSHNFRSDGPLANKIYLVYQQLILGNYWFRAEVLVINCWFVGICGFGILGGA